MDPRDNDGHVSECKEDPEHSPIPSELQRYPKLLSTSIRSLSQSAEAQLEPQEYTRHRAPRYRWLGLTTCLPGRGQPPGASIPARRLPFGRPTGIQISGFLRTSEESRPAQKHSFGASWSA